MPKKYSHYWYRTHPEVAKAFLYNCRDRDLCEGSGLPAGNIVQGSLGYVITESAVPNLAIGPTGSIISDFLPTHRCEWMEFTLPCMTTAPAATSKKELRQFNYIIAELVEIPAVEKAKSLNVPRIPNLRGKHLVNLEIATFQRQGWKSPRRATLL